MQRLIVLAAVLAATLCSSSASAQVSKTECDAVATVTCFWRSAAMALGEAGYAGAWPTEAVGTVPPILYVTRSGAHGNSGRPIAYVSDFSKAYSPVITIEGSAGATAKLTVDVDADDTSTKTGSVQIRLFVGRGPSWALWSANAIEFLTVPLRTLSVVANKGGDMEFTLPPGDYAFVFTDDATATELFTLEAN